MSESPTRPSRTRRTPGTTPGRDWAAVDDATGDERDDLLRGADAKNLTPRAFGWILLVAGAVGLVGAAWLAIERYLKLIDPDHVAACSLNPFLDCGPAMASWQGALLGFPNPFLGVAAFPVVMTIGVVVLTGARLPRWFWLTMLAVTTVAMGLVVFLVWTSLYALVVLCPFCMVVWAAMLPIFWFQVVHAVQEGHLKVSEGVRRVIVDNKGTLLAVLYVLLVAWVFLEMGPTIVEYLQTV
ncbi:vitamin K epoxide reductase family protein [Oerskovia jenensis]|uniref:vitamin K epoxide reductase family protein n=1 Tax=Oerskovia jenensis TaxID=162169 RepID=UPI0036DC9F47